VSLDNDPEVKMFFKIPNKFKIETSIGILNLDGLRTPEKQKIHCGKCHFAAVDSGVELRIAVTWDDIKVRG